MEYENIPYKGGTNGHAKSRVVSFLGLREWIMVKCAQYVC